MAREVFQMDHMFDPACCAGIVEDLGNRWKLLIRHLMYLQTPICFPKEPCEILFLPNSKETVSKWVWGVEMTVDRVLSLERKE